MTPLRDATPHDGQRVILEHFGPQHVWTFTPGRWVLHPDLTNEHGQHIPAAWLYALQTDRWEPAEGTP